MLSFAEFCIMNEPNEERSICQFVNHLKILISNKIFYALNTFFEDNLVRSNSIDGESEPTVIFYCFFKLCEIFVTDLVKFNSVRITKVNISEK